MRFAIGRCWRGHDSTANPDRLVPTQEPLWLPNMHRPVMSSTFDHGARLHHAQSTTLVRDERFNSLRRRLPEYNEDDCTATRILLDAIRRLPIAQQHLRSPDGQVAIINIDARGCGVRKLDRLLCGSSFLVIEQSIKPNTRNHRSISMRKRSSRMISTSPSPW